MRNLRKCIDRIFRKIVAKMEDKRIAEIKPESPEVIVEGATAAAESHPDTTSSAPTLYKAELPERIVKDYNVTSRNLELFLDVPPTDD